MVLYIIVKYIGVTFFFPFLFLLSFSHTLKEYFSVLDRYILVFNCLFFQTFLDGEQAAKYLTSELRKELIQNAANSITHRYHELAADLISVVC